MSTGETRSRSTPLAKPVPVPSDDRLPCASKSWKRDRWTPERWQYERLRVMFSDAGYDPELLQEAEDDWGVGFSALLGAAVPDHVEWQAMYAAARGSEQ
jgi:hypothetical protein